MLPLALLLVLHTRNNNNNNTDGNKLVIFSGTASCYKVILIHVEALLLMLCTCNKLMIFSHIWQSQVEINGMQRNNVRFLPGTATYSLAILIPYFFHQMPRLLLFSLLTFVWLLCEGSDHLRGVLIFLRKAHRH